MKNTKIAVIHGPNLNLLGQRENKYYGEISLPDLNDKMKRMGHGMGIDIDFFQSNHEGKIVDQIHYYRNNCSGMIINPGGLTHYSIVLRDALAAFSHPVIEVHLSNIFQREEFRRKSVISPVVDGVITGLKVNSYLAALEALGNIIKGGKYSV